MITLRILEYGSLDKPTLILIHGFESPYQIWNQYIKHYQEKYHILIPILPGHDLEEKSELTSFDEIAKNIEDYCLSKSIHHIYAVYGMSMGGVLAACLWKNQILAFDKIIFESSPLLSFSPFMIKQYLSITHKARQRNPNVIKKAIHTMVTEENLDVFLKLLDQISDETIKKYIQEIGVFQLPANIHTPNTQIIYFYGEKINEVVFRNVASYIKKNYSQAITICLKEKGHCEDSLLDAKRWLMQLDQYI